MDQIKKLIKNTRRSLVTNTIIGIVLLLTTFGIGVGALSYVSFTNAYKEEYSTTSYHMADAAASLVKGDYIDVYLQGNRVIEYQQTLTYLNAFTKRMNVSLTYVIRVDTSDYTHFTSVFNCVNNDVDNSNYEPWPMGYVRQTTDSEYRHKYMSLYAGESEYETVFVMKPRNDAHPHVTTLVPVKNGHDEVTAILCIQRPIRELEDARKSFIFDVAILGFLLAILAAVTTVFYTRKRYIQPILRASEEATRFAKENTKGADLENISNFEEIEALGKSINTMETDMVNYMKNLKEVTAKQERFEAELSFAQDIQRSALPSTFPAFPDRKDVDIYASVNPAKEVGGDFYNFFFIDDDHLALVIGDVSDKGVPAALFMMISNLVIAERMHMGGTPSEIMEFANNHLMAYNKSEMFVTVWVGIVEISTGKVVCTNAGHEDPIIYRKGQGYEIFKEKHDLVAGAMRDVKYKDYEFTLNKGDKLFIYTDGLPEATNTETQMFTVDGAVEALNEIQNGSPKETVEYIANKVSFFVGEAPQFDDITLVCFELKE